MSKTRKLILPLPHLYLPMPRLPLPRRISDEERREEYRRERFGPPGPVDAWVAAHSANTDNPSAPLAADEVRCAVYVQRIEVSCANFPPSVSPRTARPGALEFIFAVRIPPARGADY